VPADWWKGAACQSADPDLFFPVSEKGRAGADVARARRVCMSCPVQAPCLDYALSTYPDGIWGGTTEDERKRLRRRRVMAARRPAGAVPDPR
jgi:WhiB family redox-sensing transcriptional regulator